MTETAVDSAPRSLPSVVNRIAGLLHHTEGALTSGDVAAIRRMDPHRPAAAFFKIQGLMFHEQVPFDSSGRLATETRWAAIVLGLAHLGTLHRPGARLGRALVHAGLSELRFARLLRADVDRLIDEIPMLARHLVSKDVAADWAEAAWLLLSARRSDEERPRRRLARDYYRALASKNSN